MFGCIFTRSWQFSNIKFNKPHHTAKHTCSLRYSNDKLWHRNKCHWNLSLHTYPLHWYQKSDWQQDNCWFHLGLTFDSLWRRGGKGGGDGGLTFLMIYKEQRTFTVRTLASHQLSDLQKNIVMHSTERADSFVSVKLASNQGWDERLKNSAHFIICLEIPLFSSWEALLVKNFSLNRWMMYIVYLIFHNKIMNLSLRHSNKPLFKILEQKW